jgi:hypothetical protein
MGRRFTPWCRRFAPRPGKSTEPAIGSFATSKAENLRLLEEDQRGQRTIRAPDVVSFHDRSLQPRCIMCVRHDVTGAPKLDRATLVRVRRLFPTARRGRVAADAGGPSLRPT